MLDLRWADKFFMTRIFIEVCSKNSTVYTISVSINLYKLNEIKVKPKIIPTKIKKNISRSRPRLNVMIERGNT